MTTSTPEKQDGLKALTEAINKIEDTITSMGGVFAIQMEVSGICYQFD
jgi:translation initiation factor 2 subunit 1